MKKMLSVLLCGACLLSVLAGCGGTTVRAEDEQKVEKPVDASISVPNKLDDGLKNIKDGDNRPIGGHTSGKELVKLDGAKSQYGRAKDVFLQMENAETNTLYSPVSLEMALGLLSEGADGETYDQLMKFLGVESYAPQAEVLLDYATEVTTPDMAEDESEVSVAYEDDDGMWRTALNFANSLWVNNKYSLTREYLDTARASYDATSQALDFSNSEEVAQIVNGWCDTKTRGLIKGILTPDMITKDLAILLCNSVYFESAWYDPWTVAPGWFHNADGSDSSLDEMLYSTEHTYFETDNAVAFSKSYVSGAKFIGILPNEGVTLADIDLDALMASKTTQYEVKCSMPKLNYDFTCAELVRMLKELGVVDAFDPDVAKLDGLVNEDSELYVSDILQKCKIELDENGTKAAAVTSIFVKDNAAFVEPEPVKEVHLDRPFYYMIVDENVGQVLFIGAVNTVEA